MRIIFQKQKPLVLERRECLPIPKIRRNVVMESTPATKTQRQFQCKQGSTQPSSITYPKKVLLCIAWFRHESAVNAA